MVFLCLTAQIEMYIRKMDVAKSYPHGHTKNAFVFSFILDFIICYILLNTYQNFRKTSGLAIQR